MLKLEEKELVGALAIEHLQLDGKIVAFAKKKGASTIGAACGLFEEGKLSPAEKYGAEIAIAIRNLAYSIKDGEVDWVSYWKSMQRPFCQPFLTSRELEGFTSETPAFAITKEGFGNAGAIFAKNGYSTFGSLCEGLRGGIADVYGIGAKKYDEFFNTMIHFIESLRRGDDVVMQYAKAYPLNADGKPQRVNFERDFVPYDLPEFARNLNLESLHLGKRVRALQDSGIRSVGQLADAMPEHVAIIRNIGLEYMASIDAKLRNLQKASSDDHIAWDEFCALSDIPYVVMDEVKTGSDFLAHFDYVTEKVASAISDPVMANLLVLRLNKAPEVRMRLDEVGHTVTPAITRERVRQKESRLLQVLKDALVFGDYSNLEIRIADNLSHWWKLGYEAVEMKRTSPGVLSDMLCKVWNVSPSDLAPHYPLISAVLTGEITTRTKLKETISVDLERLLANDETRSVRLSKLTFPTPTGYLSQMGIETVSDLVAAIRDRRISPVHAAKHQLLIDHMGLLEQCLDDQCLVRWDEYFDRCGAKVLPAAPPQTTSEFLQNLAKYVQEIVDAAPPTLRSSGIFAKRTSQPMYTRLTMDELANEMGSYAPGIKKEETDLLAHLKAVIIHDEWGRARAGLDSKFAAAWNSLNQLFEEAEGEVEDFIAALAGRWGASHSDIEAALPTIVAVITGYPYGRLVRHSRTAAKEQTSMMAIA